MVYRQHTEALGQQTAEQANRDRIVLFGFYAYGEPTKNSDVDRLVV